MTDLQATRLRRALKVIALLMVRPMTVRELGEALTVYRSDNINRLLDMMVEEGLVYVESFRMAHGGKGAPAAVYAMQPQPHHFTSARRDGTAATTAPPAAPAADQAEAFDTLRMLGRVDK